MYKKILSGLMALAMVVPAFANVSSAGGTGSVPVELNAAATSFSVTVPTGLPVDVAADGAITVSDKNYIVNNSFGPVEVKGAKIETANGWTLKDFGSRFETLKVNAKEFGFQLNGCNVGTDGSVAVTNFQPIDGKASQKFTYDAKVAPQADELSTRQIASVIFTVGWLEKNTLGSNEIDAIMMANQLCQLTGKITFSKEPAPDTAKVLLNNDGSVVAEIQGQNATIYAKNGGGVFAPVSSRALFTNNPNAPDLSYPPAFYATSYDFSGLDTSRVENMDSMFLYCRAKSLDLSTFDTSNVTNMYSMFEGVALDSLDLSSFNTEQVTTMWAMFYDTQIDHLDLSSFTTDNVKDMYRMFSNSTTKTLNLSGFNTANVSDIRRMFANSLATTIYCRTPEDMKNMQNSLDCTATGFVVGKPQ